MRVSPNSRNMPFIAYGGANLEQVLSDTSVSLTEERDFALFDVAAFPTKACGTARESGYPAHDFQRG